MSTLHELLISRRSIRRYKQQPIEPEKVRLLLEAGLLSPTSKSSRAWQFIAVDDPDKLARMATCKTAGAAPIGRCPLAIVIAIDPAKSEAWIEDASAAAMSMLLQAEDLGLGGCWIEVRDRYMADGTPAQEVIQEILGMPDTLPVVCVLSFGYKDEERKPQDVEKLLWENVHVNQWEERDI